jgi:hypothetical protein
MSNICCSFYFWVYFQRGCGACNQTRLAISMSLNIVVGAHGTPNAGFFCWVDVPHLAIFVKCTFLVCQVHIVKRLLKPLVDFGKSSSSKCQIANSTSQNATLAKSSTSHHQCYITNFPSWLDFAGCLNDFRTAQKNLKHYWLPNA